MSKNLLIGMFVLILVCPFAASAASDNTIQEGGAGMGYVAVAIVVGFATLGAGIAVGMTGSAAVGALAEKPEMLGKFLILIGLAEGLAIYGLIVGIMILGKV